MRYSPLIFIGTIFLLLPTDAWAVLTEKGVLDSVLENYQSATKQWAGTIQNHATTLFLYLVGISMVWNFIPLIFRRSSIAEFFGEMFRFLTFTGFYLWLLRNVVDKPFAAPMIKTHPGFGWSIAPAAAPAKATEDK